MPQTHSTTWQLTDAGSQDVASAVEGLVLAFDGDPHMAFLFPVEPAERRRLVAEFFEILMSVRLALGAPVKVLKPDGHARGIVMGYSTSRLPWPLQWQDRWEALQDSFAEGRNRFTESDAASARFEPTSPHYYLGVVGLHPSLQGRGAGSALVRGFCALSDMDLDSDGTYIETCNPSNVALYQHCGFTICGQQALDHKTALYCMFRPKNREL